MADTDQQAKKQDEPKFTVEDLIDRPAFLDSDAATVAGAFDGEGRQNEFTVAQGKDRIRKWLKQEVTTDTAEPSADDAE